MITGLIRWSASHAVLVVVATCLLCLAGIAAVSRVPLDALPDLSDTQVIITTEYAGQPAQVVEDQVTYPISAALVGTARARVVRGMSTQGTSFVTVIFADGTDLYWGRARVLEQLAQITQRLPAGVVPALGPDATGVGWIYQYVVSNKTLNLSQLRRLQDWPLRQGLAGANGVAESASVGGYVKSYSVTVDPNRMRLLGVSLAQLRDALRASNLDIGARTIELAESDFAIQGRGRLKSIADIETAVIRSDQGVPVLVKDLARVELTGDERRGLIDYNGDGEAVSGVVLQRTGANTLSVIEAVKARLAEIAPSLPKGTDIVPVYDRSELIHRAIATLQNTLFDEIIIVALVCWLFLRHRLSALVIVVLLPAGVLLAYLLMYAFGLTTNIMSLGGIAIAVGAMVDAALVMVENALRQLDTREDGQSRRDVIIAAAAQVGPALFMSLLVITVSFLPILALESEEGRLFRPLAYTKTFAMAAAAVLSVTLVPALMVLLMGGRTARAPIRSLDLNTWMIAFYRPVLSEALHRKGLVLACACALLIATAWPMAHLGREFMPQLNEGALLFMPTAAPGLSVTKATELLQTQDRIIKSFPEVDTVLGKAGRAMTATDPAPMEMFETLITLKPEFVWRPGMTTEKLVAEMDQALQIPGVSNAWTMPIRARIDMLATGIRTTLGVKIFGDDLPVLDRIAREVESTLRTVPGTTSAYAERVMGGRILNITPDRAALARYGLTVGDVQGVIGAAIGGEPVTKMTEGRERYTIAVRYPRALRSDPDAIAHQVYVPLPAGKGSVPLGEIARVSLDAGPASIRSENARQAAYVLVDFKGRDLAGYVTEAKAAIARIIDLPPGYILNWSGQFEHMERAQSRLALVVPATLIIVLGLLYLTFRRMTETLIVMLSLPFALIGGIWLMWLMNFSLSVAGGAGFIALAGVAAETGVVMLIYLDQAVLATQARQRHACAPFTSADLARAIEAGAVDRVRPKIMTVAAVIAGLVPILWSHGAGCEVMQRIAVPMIGGMITSALLTLIVIPVVYALVKERSNLDHRSVESNLPGRWYEPYQQRHNLA